MPEFRKLVRDGIPELLKRQGLSPSVRILDHDEYAAELRRKLQEETEEYFTALTDQDALEELADVMEILYALAETHGASPEQLEQIRSRKAGQRGSFKERVYLIEVPD